ncbi:unnamed protein product [Polarella glacialis]|uniref:TFIIS N-terminal domain-containing protein n=1 Tax=Polarella glacialis TaxID=89957 RepID=A0A813JFG1_POLGL|nr:unnamed protein product [Polarella glacialis]CAE8675845.1 unnamed protein product [Polarella glacialis]
MDEPSYRNHSWHGRCFKLKFRDCWLVSTLCDGECAGAAYTARVRTARSPEEEGSPFMLFQIGTTSGGEIVNPNTLGGIMLSEQLPVYLLRSCESHGMWVGETDDGPGPDYFANKSQENATPICFVPLDDADMPCTGPLMGEAVEIEAAIWPLVDTLGDSASTDESKTTALNGLGGLGPLSAELLRSTHVGRIVNSLSRNGETDQIRLLARSLVDRWRADVEPYGLSPACADQGKFAMYYMENHAEQWIFWNDGDWPIYLIGGGHLARASDETPPPVPFHVRMLPQKVVQLEVSAGDSNDVLIASCFSLSGDELIRVEVGSAGTVAGLHAKIVDMLDCQLTGVSLVLRNARVIQSHSQDSVTTLMIIDA